MKELDELIIKVLWGQLRSMGLFSEKTATLVNLKGKFELRDLYSQWLEESIKVLARNHYLHFDGVKCSVQDTSWVDMENLWNQWDMKKVTWLQDPNMKARVVLVEVMLRSLPEILTGKVPATDIMFPNSSMELVQGIYKHNQVADFFNGVVADTIVAYIEERLQNEPSLKVNILEIGAGTGGTSAMVFQKLRPYQNYIQEYCYTDISKAFLLHAEQEYGPDNPYLKYKIFNVELPVAGQDIKAGHYDIVLATNVLHATKNIRQTIRNAKGVLQKNGLIILNEISSYSLFTHLTFGLLEGWWLYEDAGLRILGCPGLYPATWQTVLEREGFRSVFFPVQEAHEMGQQVVVAESDGVVWQKHLPKHSSVATIKQSIRSQPTKNNSPQPSLVENKKNQGQKPKVIRGNNVTDQMVMDYVRSNIRESIASSLKMEEARIQDDRSFSEYGIDSIIAVNLVNLISKQFKITLQTTVLFDYNNVHQLVRHIIKEHNATLAVQLWENGSDGGKTGREHLKEIKHPVPKGNHTDDSHQSRLQRSRHMRLDREGDDESKRKQNPVPKVEDDDIAIIGISGRFAQAKTVDELWTHLANGTDLIEEVSRWDLAKHYAKDTIYCNHGSFLADIDQFDPQFFNISGLEATYMDPQQRVFLEEAWKALEDAGYAGAGIQGRACGVYLGCVTGDYHRLFNDNPPAQSFWGNAGSVIPARIAYYLDLKGPAVAIDTACSSSLVAIHLACRSLWSNETELALAGGIFIQSTPEFYLACNRASMLSPTGRCHTFDAQADGFVPGEGAGVVVLKRLNEAIKDGDQIYGVIRGTGINQDGTTNGITAPSANSQERLERYVYDTFAINPGDIQMIEAHGTGTKLGDPIEYQALTRAFKHYTDKSGYCAIGSIKTNLGHTVSSAGVAGLIKILLSLKHKKIPPTLHFQKGNSNIEFANSPFYVNTKLKDWEVAPNSKRYAAISSFGFSGTNAHMVIEEAPQIHRAPLEKPGYLMVVSARTAKQLRQQVRQLLEYCGGEPEVNCGDMSLTLLLGRKHFNHRLACVVRNNNELVKFLKKWLDQGKVTQLYVGELHENDHREQPALKRFGNQSIADCICTDSASNYLEQLSLIAELYVQGYALDYEQLFSNDQYTRISLPTYPFATDSYWVPKGETKVVRRSVNETLVSPIPLGLQNISNASEGNQEENGQEKVCLEPLTEKASTLSIITEKPNGISLGTMSDEQKPIILSFHNSEPELRLIHQPNCINQHLSVTAVAKVTSEETLQIELMQSLAEALYMKVEDIDVDKKFIDMGLDSIIGVEWIKAINLQYSTSITSTKIYDYPSIREFAGFLVKELEKQGNQTPRHLEITISNQPIIQPLTEVSLESKKLIEVQVHPLSSNISMESLMEELRISLAEALYMKVEDVDADKKFIDMGLDSIIGVEWIKAINNQYGTAITSTKVYDYPSIRELADFLIKELNKQSNQPPKKALNRTSEPIATQGQVYSPPSYISVETLQAELTTSLTEALYLKVEDVDIDKKFIDMGLDSIIGVEWIRAINKQYGTSITTTKVYDYPSIRELAGFLAKEINQPTPSLSFNAILQQVHSGKLDIEQADQLIRQLNI